uniref:protein MIZU-KUSSEI 1-like n=1 Tax=Erigeron canadensis TaxID=72917 RepID=UPI001CB916C7|nr:protein MIZU-KUSSEI 1-like [Erigeron canadensis]
MKQYYGLLPLSKHTSNKIIPSNYIDHQPLVGKGSPISRYSKTRSGFTTLIHSFLTIISIPSILPTFRWPTQISLTPSLNRKVTCTLFGNRRGHVSFAVQYESRSAPLMIIEFGVSTASLVKEMSSGLVRIALECEKIKQIKSRLLGVPGAGGDRYCKLFNEPKWTMYVNGKKCGYASSRVCSDSDWHLLSMVQSVSVGAGVIPVVEGARKSNAGGCRDSEGELVYMRAVFERVVGSRDSEAYYMMNLDGNGGPELSIFLLRL